MISLILTALENKRPLNSFSFLDFRMTKSTKPRIDRLNIEDSALLYPTDTFNILVLK